jgi:tape measure domain-containing protein
MTAKKELKIELDFKLKGAIEASTGITKLGKDGITAAKDMEEALNKAGKALERFLRGDKTKLDPFNMGGFSASKYLTDLKQSQEQELKLLTEAKANAKKILEDFNKERAANQAKVNKVIEQQEKELSSFLSNLEKERLAKAKAIREKFLAEKAALEKSDYQRVAAEANKELALQKNNDKIIATKLKENELQQKAIDKINEAKKAEEALLKSVLDRLNATKASLLTQQSNLSAKRTADYEKKLAEEVGLRKQQIEQQRLQWKEQAELTVSQKLEAISNASLQRLQDSDIRRLESITAREAELARKRQEFGELANSKILADYTAKLKQAYLSLGASARLTDPAKGLIQHQGASYGKPITAQDTTLLVNEMNQRLALTDKEYQIASAKTKYGADSVQIKRLEAQKELTRLEQQFAKEREKIESSNKTSWAKEEAIKKLIHEYEGLIAKQKELTRSTEQLKTAHIDLWQFIGKSMLIWRAYNFLLSESRQLLMSIPKVGMELETSKSILSATMADSKGEGGKAGAEVALRGLHDEAKRTGIAIDALRENWRTFSASTTIAGESVNTSWRIFTNMNTVITALHYSSDKATHIFMALAQMFNKSKVQSEELVKQLGNLLPGAFAAFAQANGKTTQELASQMKKGIVFAHDTIEKFTIFYAERFKGAFNTASHSLNANLGRMNTAFIELGETIYTRVSPNLTALAIYFTEAASAGGGLSNAVLVLMEAVKPLTVMISSIAAFKGLSFLFGTIEAGATVAGVTLATASTGLATFLLRLKALRLFMGGLGAAGIVGAVSVGVYWLYNKVKENSYEDFFTKFNKDLEEFDNAVKAKQPESLEVKITKDSEIIKFTDHAIKARENTEKLQFALKEFQLLVTKGTRNKVDTFTVDGTPYSIASAKVALVQYREAELQAWARLKQQRTELRSIDLEETTKAASESSKAYNEALERSGIAHLKNSKDLKEKELGLIREFNEITRQNDVAAAEDKRTQLVKQYNLLYGVTKDQEDRIAQLKKDFKEGKVGVNKDSIEGAEKDLKDFKAKSAVLRANAKDWKAQYNQQVEDVKENNSLLANLDEERRKHIEQGLQKQEKAQEDYASKVLVNAKKLNDARVKDAEEFASKEQNRIDKELKFLSKTELDRTVEENQRSRNALLDQQIAIQDRLIAQLKELNKEQTGMASLSSTSEAKSSRGIWLDLELLKASKSKQHGFDFDKVDAAFKEASKTSGVDEYIIKALAKQESTFNRNVKSPVGAEGFTQFMPDTARQYAVNVKDEVSSILGTGRYLKDAMIKFDGDIRKVITSYNTGIHNVATHDINLILSDKWARNKKTGVGQTKQYVQNVLAFASKDRGTNLSDDKESYAANLATQEKKREDLIAQRQLSDEEGLKLLKERVSVVTKMQNAYEAAYGIISSASDKFYAETKLEAERILLLYEEGDTALTKMADGYFKNREAVLALMKAKENLAEIENRSVVNLNQYKVALQDLDRLQNAGMSSGISAMLERDAANRAQIPDLQAKLIAEQGLLDSGKFGSIGGDAYTEQFKKVEALKASIKDLAMTSQSTMLFAAQSVGTAFDTTFRGVLDGSIKAKDAFTAFGVSVLKTLQDIILQELKSQIIKLAFSTIGSLAGGFGGGSTTPTANLGGVSSTQAMSNSITPSFGSGKYAKGGAFDPSGIIPFAKGGIVSSPTLFKFAKGTGLMGEAGAEMIMPAARDSQGRLGVHIAGGAAAQTNISNVYNITVTQAKDATADETGAAVLKQVKQYVESTVDGKIAKAIRPAGQLNRSTKFS